MANKKNRTESVADVNGRTFKVGDGVHWGFNGDAYPGTVLFVSDSGRKVWVSNDKYKVTDGKGGFVEGARGCEFTMVPRALCECSEWTLRKNGKFTNAPNKHANTLHPERMYAQNPSF